MQLTSLWYTETFMIKYNAILKERSQSIEDSVNFNSHLSVVNAPRFWLLHIRRTYIESTQAKFRSQNEELKLLLNQYLGSKVNQELYVPPTATIARLGQ